MGPDDTQTRRSAMANAIAQIEEGAKQRVQRLEGLYHAPDAVAQLCKIVAGQFQIIASLATLFGNTGALLSEVVGQQHVDWEVLHDTREALRENTDILSESFKYLHNRLSLVEETLENLGFLGEDDNI